MSQPSQPVNPGATHRADPPREEFPILPTPTNPLPAVHRSTGALLVTALAPTGWWRVLRGFWRIVDPKFAVLPFSGLFLGTCLAAHEATLQWVWLAWTAAGLFVLEAAKTASSELFSGSFEAPVAEPGGERSPFTCGRRVLVDRLLTRAECGTFAAVAYLIGIAIGLTIVRWQEPRVLWPGLAGVVLIYFCHAPPIQLAFRGLGEPGAAFVYGPLITAGSYLVQRHTLTLGAVAMGVPLGLAIAGFMWIAEFPDVPSDQAANRRNLVVRLGRVRASWTFAAMMLAVPLLLGLLPLAGLPHTVLFGWAAVVPGAFAARILLSHPEHPVRMIPAQAFTLIAFLLLALASGVGVLLAP